MVVRVLETIIVGLVIGLMHEAVTNWADDATHAVNECTAIQNNDGEIRIVEKENEEAWIESDTTTNIER